jgi:2-polyprenyl-6-hydroxyphenyl methylase / 3-demethylubiquinone-9 3-methyltransferase
MPTKAMPVRARNDPDQYDDLTDEWWLPFGKFAALHWLARSRANLIPAPPYPGAVLLDVACGAGLLARYLSGPDREERLAGWRHVGVDLSRLSLRQADQHGVVPVQADVFRLPFADGSLTCVVAGEILEHLPDLEAGCAELARVLAPGGTLVIDTLNDTRFCRIALVRIAERLPGGPPYGIHDPALLVDPERLSRALAEHGVRLGPLTGLRPSARDLVGWLLRRREQVRMLPTGSVAGVYQGIAVKDPA